MSTEPALLEKAAPENWFYGMENRFYGRACPLERMSALECGSRLANFRLGQTEISAMHGRAVGTWRCLSAKNSWFSPPEDHGIVICWKLKSVCKLAN
jgi:hypothetical protein